MKLIVAIVQDQDEQLLSRAFKDAEIAATKLSSTGSFLRSGNTTFILGIEEDRINDALAIIRDCSERRSQYVDASSNYDMTMDATASFPMRVEVGGAIVFVLPVEQFYRF